MKPSQEHQLGYARCKTCLSTIKFVDAHVSLSLLVIACPGFLWTLFDQSLPVVLRSHMPFEHIDSELSWHILTFLHFAALCTWSCTRLCILYLCKTLYKCISLSLYIHTHIGRAMGHLHLCIISSRGDGIRRVRLPVEASLCMLSWHSTVDRICTLFVFVKTWTLEALEEYVILRLSFWILGSNAEDYGHLAGWAKWSTEQKQPVLVPANADRLWIPVGVEVSKLPWELYGTTEAHRKCLNAALYMQHVRVGQCNQCFTSDRFTSLVMQLWC